MPHSRAPTPPASDFGFRVSAQLRFGFWVSVSDFGPQFRASDFGPAVPLSRRAPTPSDHHSASRNSGFVLRISGFASHVLSFGATPSCSDPNCFGVSGFGLVNLSFGFRGSAQVRVYPVVHRVQGAGFRVSGFGVIRSCSDTS
jgi:hypothetical protein